MFHSNLQWLFLYIVFLYIVFLFSLYVFNYYKNDMITKSCDFFHKLLLREWCNAKQSCRNRPSCYLVMLYYDIVSKTKAFVYRYKVKKILTNYKFITSNNYVSVLWLGIVSQLFNQFKNAR